MTDVTNRLKDSITIETDSTKETLEFYSHDTSLFEIYPEAVVFPKSSAEIEALVSFVNNHKAEFPSLSLTARSGGSDMSGGAINESLIVDVSKHLNKTGEIEERGTWVEPGVFYRDFEKKTLRRNLYLPTYPASKNMCAIGGMIGNNTGGEKSLIYGKTLDYVTELKAVLADGKEYIFKDLTTEQLAEKLKQKDFEGKIYREVYKIVTENYEAVLKAKPNVSKNSMGYNLWDVWNGETFNLIPLFVGSQGTLGIVTKAKVRLIPAKKYSGLLVVYLKGMERLPELINIVVEKKPETFEAFDDHTLLLALKFIPQFIKILGPIGTIGMGLQFLPQLLMFATMGIPKFTFLVEFEGDTKTEVDKKIDALNQQLKILGFKTATAKTPIEADRYKLIRRESFNLLRKNISNRHTAPFIDDFIVPPETLPQFFPKLTKILEDYNLDYTIAGHMGDGNFHVIPLMDLSIQSERDKIPVVSEKVYDLVMEYKGSMSAEHNEGMIRGPYAKNMFGSKIFNLFKQVKEIFDPQNIFNPHKKTDADLKYSLDHIRLKF